MGASALFLVMLGAAVMPGAAKPASANATCGVFVVSDRDGNDEVYAMNADGSGQANLTGHPDGDYSPT